MRKQIADAVAGRVQPLLEHEFRGLTENGREAVLAAVRRRARSCPWRM
ncbi:hypothetical protein STRAU_3773 [Streptomyces aurantiacus JA 4570]|uniref:NACHT N-terminal Helical domain-containing protein n=1 Tax=Streptomyces aurantiacus JA 4570 TaxID=1286094 RepID=S4ANY5_9ACTN|nr:hypothetical protein STRAU_3773 [Streptomyces aurantiacus JA 4570]